MQSSQVNWKKDDYSNIETPFEGDKLAREKLAQQLTNYVSRLKVGATISIDAEWGAGKTWFVQHWKKKLEKEQFEVVYLDAFINDYLEDPFLLITMEIAAKLEQGQGVGAELKEKAVAVWHALLPNLPMLLCQLTLSLSGMGMLASTVSGALQGVQETTGEFGEKFAEVVNEKVKEQLENKISSYEADKKSLQEFKQQLTALAATLDKHLIFIIDELDRCKPEFSIRLIERIKHFFDIPNIVFVLAINKETLVESVNSYYGFKEDRGYLDKFIDFNIKINLGGILGGGRYDDLIESVILDLGIYEKYQVRGADLFYEVCWLAYNFNPTPRQIRKSLNKLALVLNDENKKYLSFMYLTLFLLEINVLKSKEFGAIGTLVYDKFLKSYNKKYEFSSIDSDLRPSFFQYIQGVLRSNIYREIAWALIKKENKEDWKRYYQQFRPDFIPGNKGENPDLEWIEYVQQGI